jgi:hypothetical protein
MPPDGPAALYLLRRTAGKTADAEIVANITAICNEFEAYGYRRVGAELRNRGMVVNSKKIRRLMRKLSSSRGAFHSAFAFDRV